MNRNNWKSEDMQDWRATTYVVPNKTNGLELLSYALKTLSICLTLPASLPLATISKATWDRGGFIMSLLAALSKYPAIAKLLKKEMDKEAMLGTNNPAIKMWSDKGKPQYATLEQVENDVGDISVLFQNRMPEAKDMRISEAMFPASSDLPGVMTNKRDIDEILGENLRRQEIFWAPEGPKKTPKVIEDALIRERERERIFNTNNPLVQDIAWPNYVDELIYTGESGTGLPKFRGVSKKIVPDRNNPTPLDESIGLENAINEQLQGKRFFFPVKGDIQDVDSMDFYTSYEKGRPKIGPLGDSEALQGKYNIEQRLFSPLNNRRNVFFADGSTI